MADNINTLREELEALEKEASKIAADVGKSFNKSFTSATNNAKELVEAFDKGKDITKSLEKEMRKLKNEIDSSYNLETKLNEELAKQLAKGTKASQNKANIIRQQISELQNERNLNIELEHQYRGLEKVNVKRKEANDLTKLLNLEQIKSQLTLVGLLKIIIDSALRFSQVSTNIGRNLGYGADNADRVATDLKNIAQTSTNVNVTFKNAAEAMNDISTATGYVAEYSANTLQTQIMLTKQFGLTADEAAGVYKFSVLTGKASSDINKQMVSAFAATRNNLRAGVPFKATMAEAAKVSGVLASNLQNNPSRIVEAVTQAKALGTTLEQAAKQGESLLNFESSIENELKAELLTGKQLNLERARAAALAGDQVTLTQELAKNVGTIEEFDRMNVLQKKAIAEAVGLTADELANQLRNQKLALESGKSLSQVTEEELLKAEQRQSAQETFNAALEKMQDIVGNLVAGPLGTMLEIFSKILGNSISLSAILGGVLAVNLYRMVKTLKEAGKISRMSAISDIISAAFRSIGGWPVVGMALAGAAAGAGIAYLTSQMSKADDMVSPGYGKRILSSPEGSIALNDKDTIVAGTNLGGGGMDLTPMINAINEVRAAVNSLANRPVVVNMDSKQVGTSLVQNTYKMA